MNTQIVYFLTGFIFGTILGSFLKVLADRSLEDESFKGRSVCPKCKHKLGFLDLIPIASYILLKGKCRYCKKPIPSEYLLIEVLTGLLIGSLFLLYLPKDFLTQNLISQIFAGVFLLFQSFIVVVLLVSFLTDIKSGIIPDRITYPAIIISTIYLFATTIINIVLLYLSLRTSEVGKYLLPPHSTYFQNHAFILAEPLIYGLLAAFLMVIFFGGLIFVTRGKGMGGGDLKLGIFLGLVFGLPYSLIVLMLSFLTGSVAGIILLMFRKKKFGQTIPFGPFLALGGIITLFWGRQILDWYLNLGR